MDRSATEPWPMAPMAPRGVPPALVHPWLWSTSYERGLCRVGPPMAPLDLRGVFLVGFTSKFADNLGLIACKLITLFLYSYMLLFKHARVFSPRFLESRNYKIQIVARVGRKSVVVLSGIMEASYSHFFIGIDFNCSRSIFQCLSKSFKNYP